MLHSAPTAPAAGIEHASSTIAPLHDRLWAAATDQQLVDGIHALVEHEAKVAAVRVQLLAEITAREIPKKQLQWSSNAEWWAHLAGVSLPQAHKTVKNAPLLVGEHEPVLEAMADGKVSADQAELIARTLDQFPLDPDLRRRGEQVMLDDAGRLDVTQLRRTAAYLLEQVDPDKADRRAEAALGREERAAHLGRDLTITEDGMGGVRIRGRGSVEDGATLRAALLPLTKPVPGVDPENPDAPETDPRDHGARMWDALIGIAQHALDTDLPPTSHGARPRIAVMVRLDDLTEDLRQRYRARNRTPDAAPTGHERADDATPFTRPDRPDDTPVTEDGLPLSAAAVRRLACDADIIPMVLGSDGQILDVGRTQRLVTTALWLALIARDRHCTWPGCTRPPLMGHAHHVVHWADGGVTALHNLVLLCGHHHRAVHDTPWQVRLNPDDGRPEFLPPPRHGAPSGDDWVRHRPRRE